MGVYLLVYLDREDEVGKDDQEVGEAEERQQVVEHTVHLPKPINQSINQSIRQLIINIFNWSN